MADTNESKKEYREFRALLRKGIGCRTQKEFAVAAGISPAYLNKMLKNDMIPTPTRDTISNLAKHMTSVTKNELLEACGYEVLSVQEDAEELVHDLLDFLNNKNGCMVWHGTMDELFENINMLYCPKEYNALRLSIISDEKNVNAVEANFKDAENIATIRMIWSNDETYCRAEFSFYYSKTASGNFIIFGAKPNLNKLGQIVMVREQDAVKKERDMINYMLFGCLSNYGEQEILPSTLVGPGLPYDKTPDGFRDFLSNHRATFCTTKKRCELWKRVVENGEDPDAVFESCEDEDGNMNSGTGLVVATIIGEETKDIKCDALEANEFLYYPPCKDLDEKDRNAFVMVENIYNSSDIDKDLCERLYLYAKELKIPKFGLCYYHTIVKRDPGSMMSVEEFGALDTNRLSKKRISEEIKKIQKEEEEKRNQ